MSPTRRIAGLLACVALLVVPGIAPRPAGAQSVTTIRLTMVQPRSSVWGREFQRWNTALRSATGDTLRIQLQPSGSTGDEVDFVRRMRVDEVDAASLSAIGLAEAAPSLLALQAPGALASATQLDHARTALDAQLRQQLAAGGMVLLGWSDLGQARIFSTHSIVQPSDLRSSRPWRLPSDTMFGELLTRVGATGVPLPLVGVRAALDSGGVDTVVATATAVSAFQWHARLTHVMRPSSAVLVAATLYSKADYDALTAAQRTALDTTAVAAHARLRQAIEQDDARAYRELLARGMIEDDATPHSAAWQTIARETRDALVGRLYSRQQLDAVIAARGP